MNIFKHSLAFFAILIWSESVFSENLRVAVIDSQYLIEKYRSKYSSEQETISALNRRIATYARENRLSFIFQANKLHCFSERLDITKALEMGDSIQQKLTLAKVAIRRPSGPTPRCSDTENGIVIDQTTDDKAISAAVEIVAPTDSDLRQIDVAFLEMRPLIEKSKLGASLSQKLREEFQPQEEQIRKMRLELEGNQLVSDQRSTLNRNLIERENRFNADLNRKRGELLKLVVDDNRAKVLEFSKRKGYKLLVYEAVWVDAGLNRTKEFMDVLQ